MPGQVGSGGSRPASGDSTGYAASPRQVGPADEAGSLRNPGVGIGTDLGVDEGFEPHGQVGKKFSVRGVGGEVHLLVGIGFPVVEHDVVVGE
jgi:hypothetical protein